MNKIFILVLSTLCLISYLNCFQNNFVLDDEILIVNNPLIKASNFIPAIFKSSLFNSPYDLMYRPIQLLSYSLDYSIWKLKPFGFHLTNVMLHLFNAILVYFLLNLLFNNRIISMAASTLFLVHPLHISSVTYISGRADLLASFFMLLSLTAFIKFIKQDKNLFYVFSLLFGLLAVLSRENSLLLFAYIALIVFCLNKKPQYYFFAAPFILINCAYFLLRFFIFGQSAIATHTHSMSLFLRVINFLNIMPKYLSILIFPLDLHMFRTTQFITSSLDIRLIYLAGFVLFVVLLFIKFRTNKLLLFSLVWFFVGLSPVFLSLDGYAVLNKAVMSESWVYSSTIGFCVLLSLLFLSFKRVGSVLFIVFVIFYMFLTTVNNRCFKNNIILYKNILFYNGGANPLRKGLINAYFQKGLYEEAFGQIQEFGIYYPESYDFNLNSGLYYLAVGNINKAIENFSLALNKGRDEYPYYNLSICYEKLKRLDKAVDSALKCYTINPSYLPVLIRLGDLYMQKAEFSEAKKYYEKALNLNPHNKAIKNKILKLSIK
jgi:protein O-mannosyl-transferase